MVVETFLHGPKPVYERLAEQGRMLPEGLRYIDSWVSEDLTRCWQLMETDDASLFDEWIAPLSDIVAFEVVPVLESSEAASRADRAWRRKV
jgi:hypothetical protein